MHLGPHFIRIFNFESPKALVALRRLLKQFVFIFFLSSSSPDGFLKFHVLCGFMVFRGSWTNLGALGQTWAGFCMFWPKKKISTKKYCIFWNYSWFLVTIEAKFCSNYIWNFWYYIVPSWEHIGPKHFNIIFWSFLFISFIFVVVQLSDTFYQLLTMPNRQ